MSRALDQIKIHRSLPLKLESQRPALQFAAYLLLHGHLMRVSSDLHKIHLNKISYSKNLFIKFSVVALIGAFGNKALLTPGVTMIPACTCKFVACLDPYVYAISHPRYRLELQNRLPW